MSQSNQFSQGSANQIANAIQAQSLQNQFTQSVFNGWFSGVDSYKQTPAEISAGVTPVNYLYGPDHIGSDVRRYGNIDFTGATDCRSILSTANSVGVSLYFPKGTYRISTNLTLSVPCIFEFGAILKPDTGVVVTITGQIVAGPWRIFNASNTPAIGSLSSNTSLQTGFTPISGPCPIEKCYAEWFGAVGNGVTDDFAAIQAACNFSMSCYGIPVQLQAKVYFTSQTIYGGGSAYQLGTGSGGQGSVACSIYGVPAQTSSSTGTNITDNGTFVTAGGQPLLRFRNIPSRDQHNEVRDIRFDSVANTSLAIGIEFAGACVIRAVNCFFARTGLYEAVRWNNTLEGNNVTYTEFCILEKCEIWGCINASGHFFNTLAADDSYHGNGFDSRCIIIAPIGAPVVLVDNNAQWYNGVFDAQIFSNGNNNVLLIQNNNTTQTNQSAAGRITLEIGSFAATLGAGQPFYFCGSIRSNGPNCVNGNLVRCQSLVNATSSAVGAVGAESGGSQSLTAGANTLLTNLGAYSRDIAISISGTNYLVVYRLYLMFLAPGGQVVNLYNPSTGSAPVYSVGSNVAAWGLPTFSVSSLGQLIVTNSNFTGTVTANWSERQLYPGTFGGTLCVL